MSDIEPICRKCGKSIPDGSWAGVKMARRGFEYEHLQCPSPCPNCEAAQKQISHRERQIAALIETIDGWESKYTASREYNEKIERELADIAAVLRTGSSGDTIMGKEVSRWIDTAHAAEQERDDLRARLTKQVKAWRKDGRYDETAASVFDACADEVEEILAKTEAK